MQKEFFAKVATADKLASKEKITKKQRKNKRMLEVFETVKEHGGPVTEKTIYMLNNLSDEEILKEVRFLRVTVAPNIREKRKVDNKFVKFSRQELI